MQKSLFFFLLLSVAVFVFNANAEIPDTGQETSYTNIFGEDSDYIVTPQSYTKLRSGGFELPDDATLADGWEMTRDNVTGLIWEIKTGDNSIHDKNREYNWYYTDDFTAIVNNQNFGGYSDWRIPTIKELMTIVNLENYGSAINYDFFPNVAWTTWSCTDGGNEALVLLSNSGVLSNIHKSSNDSIRVVRAGRGLENDFIDNGDGTISDKTTGLMWQKETQDPLDWESAIAYCENLTLANHNDWRLPDRNELYSLVDHSKFNPSIDTLFFPDTLSRRYWSSTTYAGNSECAWNVRFFSGDMDACYYGGKSYSGNCIRAVRNERIENRPPTITIALTSTSPNHTVTAGSNVQVYGTASANQIILESGAKAELINFPGQNSIQIQSSSDLFTVSRSGTVVTFQGHDGTVLKIPATSSAQAIAFTDQTLTLKIHNNQVLLGNQVITTIPASIEGGYEVPSECGAYVAPGVWKEFDCYNLAAIGKTTNDDPFIPSWRIIGGYWQWGRKGPDPSQWYDTNTSNFAHGPTGLDAEDANSGSISGWDDEYAPDGVWSDSEKTGYDPCPIGYQVPTIAQWEGVLNNNTQSTVGTWSNSATDYGTARLFGSDLMLPAAGYRGLDGALLYRGHYGHYWSSSENGSYYAGYLYFGQSGYVGTGYGPRGIGPSVRCIAGEDKLSQAIILAQSTNIGVEFGDYIDYLQSIDKIFTYDADLDSGGEAHGYITTPNWDGSTDYLYCEWGDSRIEINERQSVEYMASVIIHEISHYYDIVEASNNFIVSINIGKTELRAHANQYLFFQQANLLNSQQYINLDANRKNAMKKCYDYIYKNGSEEEAQESLIKKGYSHDLQSIDLRIICVGDY